MELVHLCSMPTVGWAPSSIASRDYKLVGDQWRRGAMDPSLLVVAQKRMVAPMSFYQKSRHIYYKIETKNLGRLGLKHGSRGLSCGVLTVKAVGGIRKEGKSYTT